MEDLQRENPRRPPPPGGTPAAAVPTEVTAETADHPDPVVAVVLVEAVVLDAADVPQAVRASAKLDEMPSPCSAAALSTPRDSPAAMDRRIAAAAADRTSAAIAGGPQKKMPTVVPDGHRSAVAARRRVHAGRP